MKYALLLWRTYVSRHLYTSSDLAHFREKCSESKGKTCHNIYGLHNICKALVLINNIYSFLFCVQRPGEQNMNCVEYLTAISRVHYLDSNPRSTLNCRQLPPSAKRMDLEVSARLEIQILTVNISKLAVTKWMLYFIYVFPSFRCNSMPFVELGYL